MSQLSAIIDPCFVIIIIIISMKHSIIAHRKVVYIFNDGRHEQASFHQLAQGHLNRTPGCW